MKKRIKKKKDKKAITLAKKIIWIEFPGTYPDGVSYWKAKSEIKRKDIKYGAKFYKEARYDFKQELRAKEMLLKVCRKCIRDNFPIEQYALFEIPYWDQKGWIMDFVNLSEHNQEKQETKTHRIGFWCQGTSRVAIPQDFDSNCKNCFDALYTE